MMRCGRCGRFVAAWCQPCWARCVESLAIRIHAALERAGVHDGAVCWWWYR